MTQNPDMPIAVKKKLFIAIPHKTEETDQISKYISICLIELKFGKIPRT